MGIVIGFFVLFALLMLPLWPYSSGFGYSPSAIAALIAIAAIVYALVKRAGPKRFP